MPKYYKRFDILIASPGDVLPERDIAEQALRAWNSSHAKTKSIHIEPMRWERDTVPIIGPDRTQESVNKILVRDCDAAIAIFWTQIGSSTGKCESGTIEEIDEMLTAGKPIHVYFKTAEPNPGMDLSQVDKVNEYKALLRSKNMGLYNEFSTKDELLHKLDLHLNTLVEKSWDAPIVDDLDESVKKNEQLQKIVKKAKLRWTSERGTSFPSYDSGKHIFEELESNIIDCISDNNIEENLRASLLPILPRIKQIAKTRMVMDGGLSYKRFWDGGTNLLEDMEKILNTPNLGADVAVSWNNGFLVLGGDIESLDLKEDEPFQETTHTMLLEENKVRLYLSSHSDLGRVFDKGYKFVYYTDGKRWKKKIKDPRGVLLGKVIQSNDT